MKNNQLTIVDYEKIEKKPLSRSWRNNSGIVITIPELKAEIRGADGFATTAGKNAIVSGVLRFHPVDFSEQISG